MPDITSKDDVIVINIAEIAKLLSGYKAVKLVKREKLWKVYRLFDRLWYHSGKIKLPDDFRQTLFEINQCFLNYIVNEPGEFRPLFQEILTRIDKKLPQTPD